MRDGRRKRDARFEELLGKLSSPAEPRSAAPERAPTAADQPEPNLQSTTL